MFCLSSIANSTLFLGELCYSALTPAYYTFCRSYKFASFPLLQPQEAMMKPTAATPTIFNLPTPETAASLPSAGCPQVRLFKRTLLKNNACNF